MKEKILKTFILELKFEHNRDISWMLEWKNDKSKKNN